MFIYLESNVQGSTKNSKLIMKCRKCNRPLKREPWRSKGIGKICAAKEAAQSLIKSNNTLYIPYDGGDVFMERLPNGMIKTNIIHSVVKHSPTGLEFGYGGSGPADAALNILLMFTDSNTAYKHYMKFKWRFLATSSRDMLIIRRDEINEFLTYANQEQLEISWKR
ncbi:MAG: hypothetical protein KatS3mg031_2965 [Chitinophagales bacterium]|nr:MAG: hypothetical protein KatS3mg031_2965 [Chitinophagales bacterium]